MFGPHLTIDLYGCDRKALNSTELIYGILDEMPALLKMRKITKPQIISYEGADSGFDKGGISAFVIIATSHISIHTFILQKYASIDIFSCKEFDIEKAVGYISSKFGAKKVEQNLIMRGREFPMDVNKADRIVAKDRIKEETKFLK